MPSTYAHYRLGQEIRSLLNDSEKEVIDEYPELFMIGIHGPDIFFYYKPLLDNQISQIGYRMHDRAGKEFFETAAETIKQHQENAAYLSYVYGFICHFALDEICHGYIDEKIAASGISHTEIEVEFDRMLMLKDGYDPIRHKLTGHIVPSMKNAQVIQAFFEGVNSTQIQKALNGMIKNSNLLIAPSKIKRLLINTLLKISGNYKEMHGLIVNYRENPQCADSTKKLWNLYQKAKELTIELIHEYKGYLEGREALIPIYNYTFDSRLIDERVNNDEA